MKQFHSQSSNTGYQDTKMCSGLPIQIFFHNLTCLSMKWNNFIFFRHLQKTLDNPWDLKKTINKTI